MIAYPFWPCPANAAFRAQGLTEQLRRAMEQRCAQQWRALVLSLTFA